MYVSTSYIFDIIDFSDSLDHLAQKVLDTDPTNAVLIRNKSI